MKTLRPFSLIAAPSIAAGFAWDVLVWRLGAPYVPLHWLGPLFHADGESAYTAMMYETMVYLFVVFSVLWTLRCLPLKRTSK
jgi:hypothetical protein